MGRYMIWWIVGCWFFMALDLFFRWFGKREKE